MKKYIIVPIVFVAIIAGLLVAAHNRAPKQPAKTTQEIWKDSGVPVETSRVTTGDMDEVVQITGDLSALNSAVISPKISGRLTSISIREGDHVTQGQVVAVLDQGDALSNVESMQASLESAKARLAQAVTNAEVTKTQTQIAIEQAQANVNSALAKMEVVKKPSRSQDRMVAENRINSAKANLDKAEADFKRNERLLKRGAISESAFDIVKTEYIVAQSDYKSTQDQLSLIDEGGRQEDISSANSQVDVAKGQLRDAKSNAAMNKVKAKDVLAAKAGVQQAQAALDTAKRGLEYTYVKSPISGIVSARTSDPGQVVTPGQTLASIVDLGSLYLKAEISEKYLSTVRNGQSVSVNVDAMSGKVFQGKVTEIYPSGSTLNRNFSARISILGADSSLKPGMSASGEILTGKASRVLLVSKDAIDERKGIQSVFTIDSGKTAKRHQITVVREDRNYSQLGTPNDLKIGDVVVTEGHNNLQDGTAVEITKKGSISYGVN